MTAIAMHDVVPEINFNCYKVQTKVLNNELPIIRVTRIVSIMKGTENPADTVISALLEHDIPFTREEIDSLFNDDTNNARDSAEWAMEHLSTDTLLSKDELTLYSKLESSGALEDVLRNPDIGSIRPFQDYDIQTAIESLRTSTTAIQKQTGILNSQWEILNKQIHREDERRRDRGRDMMQLRRKHEQKRQNIAVASSDLSHGIESSMKSETEKATTEGKRVLSLMSAKLRDDDKTLIALEKLASHADIAGGDNNDDNDGDDASTVRQTTELSAILAGYIAEEIHCRLDRLFLQGLLDNNNGSGPGDYSTSANDEEELMSALEGELDSLYPEIGVLAEMSTKQQFSEPILRELQDHHDRVRVTLHRKLECIVDKIPEMISSIEDLTERLKDHKSFRETLEALTAVYQSELADQSFEKSTRRETMRRQSTQATTQRGKLRKSTVPLSESLAFTGFLRRLGIHHESAFQPEKENGGSYMFYEKEAHMLESLRDLDIAADSPLASQPIPMDSASQVLSSSLDADSPFARSLSNVDQEKRLTALESQLGLVQEGIEGLNLDILYQRDKAQDRFIERWL